MPNQKRIRTADSITDAVQKAAQVYGDGRPVSVEAHGVPAMSALEPADRIRVLMLVRSAQRGNLSALEVAANILAGSEVVL